MYYYAMPPLPLITSIKNVHEFNALIASNPGKIIIKFGAEWCGPCKTIESTVHHWFSNIPWSTDNTIQLLRNQKSNDEWLCEGLGAFSISSGLVFKVEDLKSCTCDRCPECHPYEEASATFNGCPLTQYYLQLSGMKPSEIPSSPKRAKQYIGERIEGIDWGQGTAPDAYTATGKLGGTIFVLDQRELFVSSRMFKLSTR